MAIQSMTGFGKAQCEAHGYQVNVEIKSVNHRFKDVRCKIPSQMTELEIPIKQKIAHSFKRGSFDVIVNTKRTQENTKLGEIDYAKVNSFLNQFEDNIESDGVVLKITPTDFMRSEFLKEQDEDTQGKLNELVLKAFDEAVSILKTSRLEEGEKMGVVLKKHKEDYASDFAGLAPFTSDYKKSVEQKLEKACQDYKEKINIDPGRLLQEVVFYLEKLDVHEELNRINSHLAKLDDILSNGGEVGRQVDFLVQELNRVTNTIGSKSNNKNISDLVVKMKVHLEKIREQGLNLE